MPAHQKGYCSEPKELIELCTSCKRLNCDGTPCARYIELARKNTVRMKRSWLADPYRRKR